MKFEQTPIHDLCVIHQTPVRDMRGEFARVYCEQELASKGLVSHYVQENRSKSNLAGTIRGLHLQKPPCAEAKLVRCTTGRIFDVAVDCRHGSQTFLGWFGIELTEDNEKLLYVPPGFAHGYQAVTDGAEASYLTSSFYTPATEIQIHCMDSRLGIRWPIKDPILSDKDAKANFLNHDFEGIAQ